ncbi:MAG TPA: hypothetical protein IAB34_08945 [Candidatus Egerieimonas faecigallinarum]|nr:hypothetical protein [Candidatus Egerieimonas faecigallinarum]
MKNNSALFYTCSLIEFIGRQQKQKRSELVQMMGKKTVERIYRYADVFHCEPIEKTADDFIENLNIPEGDFDNVAKCRYTVPDYWTIGEVYERLIEDIAEDDEEHIIDRLMEVYTSWIDAVISNYNTDFYYQSREYICECYREGTIVE